MFMRDPFIIYTMCLMDCFSLFFNRNSLIIAFGKVKDLPQVDDLQSNIVIFNLPRGGRTYPLGLLLISRDEAKP